MDELADLILAQEGMVARRQLNEYGGSWMRVRNEVAARRWVERTPRVISTFTGELTSAQREWLAVLHAGPRSMLANLSAAGRQGLTGWERPWVSVLVDDELSFEPVDGIDLFRSRRPFDVLRSPRPASRFPLPGLNFASRRGVLVRVTWTAAPAGTSGGQGIYVRDTR